MANVQCKHPQTYSPEREEVERLEVDNGVCVVVRVENVAVPNRGDLGPPVEVSVYEYSVMLRGRI